LLVLQGMDGQALLPSLGWGSFHTADASLLHLSRVLPPAQDPFCFCHSNRSFFVRSCAKFFASSAAVPFPSSFPFSPPRSRPFSSMRNSVACSLRRRASAFDSGPLPLRNPSPPFSVCWGVSGPFPTDFSKTSVWLLGLPFLFFPPFFPIKVICSSRDVSPSFSFL